MSADSPDLIRRAQEIRYQVYCVERRVRESGRPSGSQREGQVRRAFRSQPTDPPSDRPRRGYGASGIASPRSARGELCDPASNRAFRLGDIPSYSDNGGSIAVQHFQAVPGDAFGADVDLAVERQIGPLMSLGLIQTLVRMSARHGITHWCALMEPKLLRMLAAMAIHFKPLGAPVEYHGLRQPCYCHVPTVLDRVRRDRPMFWQILTDAGSKDGCALAA